VLIAVILPPQNTDKALKRRDSSDPGQNKQEKATVSRQETRRQQESSKPTLEGIVAAYITEDVEKQGVRCGSMRVVEAKPGETSSE
jgi:hypothetical protein